MEPRAKRLAAVAVVKFAALALIEAVAYWRGGPVLTDFFGLWSWSRALAEHGAAALYDPDALYRFQALLDPAYADEHYPFLYPPTALLFLWPLGHLPIGAARLLWSGVTLAGFLIAVTGWRWRPALLGVAAIMPATVLCLVCGQNGLLTASLLIGGLRLAARHPGWAGLLLGALTYKPHLALLVPVALAAAGLWRALAAAAVVAGLAAAASAVLFGPGAWLAWLAAQHSSWATIDAFIGSHAAIVPTVAAALRRVGAPPAAVAVGQLVATGAAVAAVWVVWRRPAGAPRVLAFAAASLLASPYAALYDLPVVGGAALLTMAQGRTPGPWLAMLGACLFLPQLMFVAAGATAPTPPIAAPLLALVLTWLALPPRLFGGSDRLESMARERGPARVSAGA